MVPVEVFNAAFRGDLAAIDKWLGEGGNPNEVIEEDIDDDSSLSSTGEDNRPPSTLLMTAASEGHLDVVRRLVETTVVAARLFGSLNGFADVPGPCFWRVVEYAWLGDWRYP